MPKKCQPPRLYLRHRKGRASIWVIRDGAGEKSTGCSKDNINGAKKALSEYLAAHWQQEGGNGRPDQLSVAEIILTYAKEHAPHTARPDVIAYHAEVLLKFWKGHLLSDIKGRTCRNFAQWRIKQGVSSHTARHDLEVLRAAINYYHNEYQLDVVPRITLPKKPPAKNRWLSRDEVASLLASSREAGLSHVTRFILIGIYSGTRPGAILSLKWIPSPNCGWIDIKTGVLYRRGTQTIETKKRQPPARIHTCLLPHLKRWHDHDMQLGITTVCHYKGAQIKKMRRSWVNVRNLAGLDNDVTPHTMRHTAATWLMQAGVDMWDAAGFLGMSVETLERVYGHHHADFQKEAANAIAPKTTRMKAMQ